MPDYHPDFSSADESERQRYLSQHYAVFPYRVIPHPDGHFLISVSYAVKDGISRGTVYRVEPSDLAHFFRTSAELCLAESAAERERRANLGSAGPSRPVPIDLDLSLDIDLKL